MLNTLNNPLLTITAFVLFMALAVASEPWGHGYSTEDRQQMDKLLDSVLTPEISASNAAKLVYLYGEE